MLLHILTVRHLLLKLDGELVESLLSDEFLAQREFAVVLGLLQYQPRALDVPDEHALWRNVHTLSVRLQLGLDVEEVRLDVAALAIPATTQSMQ